MSNKAYRYRIYPNKQQEIFFNKTFDATAFIWNKMLEDRNKVGQSYYPSYYKKQYEWLKEVDGQALCCVQLNMNKAFADFRNGFTNHPKFKSETASKRSYTTSCINNNIRLTDKTIRLPKAGEVKAKIHRRAPDSWQIKSVTVTQVPSGKYYASVLYYYEHDVKEHTDIDNTFGLDWSTRELYIDSNGEPAKMPRYLRKSQKKIKKMQRKLAKKRVEGVEKQSNRYLKLERQIAKKYEKVGQQRSDYLHKLSRHLVNTYDYIGIEDLDMKDMATVYGKSVNENGWGMFTRMLIYKSEEDGKHVVKADKYYPSSQICHVCGERNIDIKRDIDIRQWTCSHCGTTHNRDHNAAINLKNEARRITIACQKK